MKNFITELGNFFNKSGTMNTVVWFSVLMLACIILAMCRRKELAGVVIAGAVCMFISFSSLSLGIQAIIFAALITAWLFVCASRRSETNKVSENTEGSEKSEEEKQKNG